MIADFLYALATLPPTGLLAAPLFVAAVFYSVSARSLAYGAPAALLGLLLWQLPVLGRFLYALWRNDEPLSAIAAVSALAAALLLLRLAARPGIPRRRSGA